jgi:hypothetical protein
MDGKLAEAFTGKLFRLMCANRRAVIVRFISGIPVFMEENNAR